MLYTCCLLSYSFDRLELLTQIGRVRVRSPIIVRQDRMIAPERQTHNRTRCVYVLHSFITLLTGSDIFSSFLKFNRLQTAYVWLVLHSFTHENIMSIHRLFILNQDIIALTYIGLSILCKFNAPYSLWLYPTHKWWRRKLHFFCHAKYYLFRPASIAHFIASQYLVLRVATVLFHAVCSHGVGRTELSSFRRLHATDLD